MEFGVQFFPDVRPEEKSARDYFREALDLAEEADRLGFTHIRIVEHYFHYYGGYSPNPIVFLAGGVAAHPADAARHRRGAAGLQQPAEARRRDRACSTRSATGGSMSASPAPSCRTSSAASASRPTSWSRAIARGSSRSTCCCAQENVTHRGTFHTHREHDLAAAPDAAAAAEILCRRADDARQLRVRRTHGLFGDGDPDGRRQDARAARRSTARPGARPAIPATARSCSPFTCSATPTATRRAPSPAPLLNDYLHSLVDAAGDWIEGLSSKDYPGYDKVIAELKDASMETLIDERRRLDRLAPGDRRDDLRPRRVIRRASSTPRCRSISTSSRERRALDSLRLFGREVLPHFANG